MQPAEVPPKTSVEFCESRGASCDNKGKTKAEPTKTHFQSVMEDFRESITALRVLAETIEHNFNQCTG